MRRSYKIYMILETGKEVFLERCKTKEIAKLRCERYAREDRYERSIGYHVPDTKYVYRYE